MRPFIHSCPTASWHRKNELRVCVLNKVWEKRSGVSTNIQVVYSRGLWKQTNFDTPLSSFIAIFFPSQDQLLHCSIYNSYLRSLM